MASCSPQPCHRPKRLNRTMADFCGFPGTVDLWQKRSWGAVSFRACLRRNPCCRNPPRVAQKIIDTLGGLPDKALANRNDAAIRDAALFGDGMGFVIPTGRLQLGHNELSESIGFVRHAPLFSLILRSPATSRIVRISSPICPS